MNNSKQTNATKSNNEHTGLSFIFSSLAITLPQVRDGWLWLFYLTPLSKGVHAIMHLFEGDYRPVMIVANGQIVQTTARDFASAYLGMPYGLESYWTNIGYFCAYIVAVQIFAHFAFVFLTFQKR